MRVALVIEQFDPRRGGAEQWTAQLATQLLGRGHEVHVVAERFGEQVRRIPIVAHRLPGPLTRPGFAEAAQAKLMTLAPDVIHDMGSGWFCDVFQPHSGSMAALWHRKLKIVPRWLRPLKARADRLLPRYRQFQTLLERQYVDDGRLLVALSRKVAGDFQQYHGVPQHRIRLVYNGVDTERFSPERRTEHRQRTRRRLGIDDEKLMLLIVTHNFRLKGVPVLLQAVRRLKHAKAPVHLVVVGGKRLGGWNRAARRGGIGSMVTFTGTVDDPAPYYAAADVYAHPTFHDSCSLVVLEALASGLPVVTSGYNGAGELMTEGREGYVIQDPADVSELLGRFELLFDKATRRRKGKAARRLALKYPLKRNVDEVIAVYEESLEDRTAAWARTKRRAAAALGGNGRRQACSPGAK